MTNRIGFLPELDCKSYQRPACKEKQNLATYIPCVDDGITHQYYSSNSYRTGAFDVKIEYQINFTGIGVVKNVY